MSIMSYIVIAIIAKYTIQINIIFFKPWFGYSNKAEIVFYFP